MNFKISKNFVETFLFILTNPSVSICLPDNQAQKRRLSITDLIITFSPTLWAYTPDLGPRKFQNTARESPSCNNVFLPNF